MDGGLQEEAVGWKPVVGSMKQEALSASYGHSALWPLLPLPIDEWELKNLFIDETFGTGNIVLWSHLVLFYSIEQEQLNPAVPVLQNSRGVIHR